MTGLIEGRLASAAVRMLGDKYVHNNPAYHGIVTNAENYEWCSASWFARSSTLAFRATVEGLTTDKLSVTDDFSPSPLVPAETESGPALGGTSVKFTPPEAGPLHSK